MKRTVRLEPIIEYKSSPPVVKVVKTEPQQIVEKVQSEPVEQPTEKGNPLGRIMGQHVTIQSRAGVLYTGKLQSAKGQFVRLEDCTLVGKERTVQQPWVLLDRNSIAHVHPASDQVRR